MKKPHHIVNREAATASATLEAFARTNGQLLLPLVELVTQARVAVDEVIQQIGRQTIETILELSAQEVAGPGKPSGEVRWYGRQRGRVQLADRQLQVKAPAFAAQTGGRNQSAGLGCSARESGHCRAHPGRTTARCMGVEE